VQIVKTLMYSGQSVEYKHQEVLFVCFFVVLEFEHRAYTFLVMDFSSIGSHKLFA
jgi:hypothetical protein